jgi:hypothetical protein
MRISDERIMTDRAVQAQPPRPRSLGAERMRRHRDRRQKGLRCVRIELHETEIDLLIRRERLAGGSRGDLAAVRKALHGILEDHPGDAQQRPSDVSRIPLSSPDFGRLSVCALPDPSGH